MRRQVVDQPVGMLADDLGAVGADLLGQFAQHGRARILVRIDAALRQLPAARRALRVRQIGAAGDEHAAVPVEQHGADIRPVRQRVAAHFAASAGGLHQRAERRERQAVGCQPVRPGRDAIDGDAPHGRGEPDGTALLARQLGQPGQLVVDIGGRRGFVDHQVDAPAPRIAAAVRRQVGHRHRTARAAPVRSVSGSSGPATRQAAPRGWCRARRLRRHSRRCARAPIPVADGSVPAGDWPSSRASPDR